VDYSRAWQADTYHGTRRFSAYAAADGKRSAFVRYPDRHATVIVLTNDETADAKEMADRISERLLGSNR
jgi:hypothetical protein